MSNFLLLPMTFVIWASMLGAHMTFWFTHRNKFRKMNAIRASALSTLLFVACTMPFHFLIIPKLHAAFFGGSFVAMSEPHRLSERKVLLASFVFGLLFLVLLQFKGGIGGTLGATAFVSCLAIYYLMANNREKR
jgi:hypothetical protein